MPNPLARVQNTSKKPPERPEAIPPVPEAQVGNNQPYRGIEEHGVKPDVKPTPTQADWDTRTGRTYMKPEDEYEPIPVKIVQEHGREFRDFRVHRMSVDSSRPVQFLGRNLQRSSVYISNVDAVNALFISNRAEFPLGGFQLNPGQNLTLYTHDQIYVLGVVANPAVQMAQAIEYYTVEA